MCLVNTTNQRRIVAVCYNNILQADTRNQMAIVLGNDDIIFTIKKLLLPCYNYIIILI